jgi:hypothetical protein
LLSVQFPDALTRRLLFAGEEQIDRPDAGPRKDHELTYFTFSSLANLSAWVQISASLLLVASFAWASWLRLGEWARSWDAQLEVLHQLPAGLDKQFSSSARFLYISRAESQKIPLASAPWEISGALAYATFLRSPLAGRNTMADNWTGKSGWFAESPGWFTSWDGETMSQGFCWNQLPIYSMKVDEIWLWEAGEQQLRQASPGFRIGCPGVPK